MKNAAAFCFPAQARPRDHAAFFQSDRARQSGLPDPAPGHPADRRDLERRPTIWRIPCGEDSHMPVPGLVHRYPDRVLFLVTDRCAATAAIARAAASSAGWANRNCTPISKKPFVIWKNTPKCATCCFPAATRLLFSDDKLERIAEPAARDPAHRVSPHRHARSDFPAATHHARALRDAAEISSALDERACESSARADHGSERSARAAGQCTAFRWATKACLLAGVNDDLDTMKTLVHKLLMCRVRPYYLYQCDLINGSSHLRTSVAKGIEIIEGLRGHTTGYAVPQFVIDAPGGGGKVPINPGYVLYHDNEKIVIRNYEGKIFEYPETGNENVQFAPQREYHDEYLYS